MPTCEQCKWCENITEDELGLYYLCGVDGTWTYETIAEDETLDCDFFVEKLDDNKTKEPSA